MLKGLVARISLVFAVAAIAVCVATFIDALALTGMSNRVRVLLARDMVEAVGLTRSQNHLLRMNSNLTGAVLANKQDFQAASVMVKRSLADYMARLEEVRGSSPEAAARADALALGFREVVTAADQALALMRAGDERASRAVVATGVTPAVERQVERARELINSKWELLEADRHAALHLADVRWWEIVALGAVYPLPAVLALLWLAGPGLRRPMRQLTAAADRLRAGDLIEPVAGLGRADEVGSIAQSLDKLRREALRVRALEAEARDLEAAAEAARLRDLTDAAFEGLAITTGDTISEVNTSLAAMLGLDRDALIGALLTDLLTFDDGQALVDVLESASLLPARAMLAWDGDAFPIEIRTRGLAATGAGSPRMVVAVRDLRGQAAAEAQIRHMAHHDALTGVANRTLLAGRMREAIAVARRTGAGFALLCVDLDRFKPINDLHGHTAGDSVLCEVARRLRTETREIDTVARLGGDEFVVLQSGVNDVGQALELAGRLVTALQAGIEIAANRFVSVSASIGVALYPDDGAAPDALLANADSALYRVKRSTRNGFAVFQADRDAGQHERHLLEQDLRLALPAGEFSLAYQTQVLCETGTVVGFEALIRWNHPIRGTVSPAAFIPIAEEDDLILDIGAWVLREACAEAAGWHAKQRIAVNVSPRQLEHDGFPELVAATLAETGLDPSRLELEITENLLIRDADRALKIVLDLKALGVNMALDDFGTGYSSLGTLGSFPFDRLKIDRSFIQNLTGSGEARAIVSAVVALGHALNISVLAEGVETEAQLDILRDEGCDEVQGFLIGRPAKIAHHRDLTFPAAALDLAANYVLA